MEPFSTSIFDQPDPLSLPRKPPDSQKICRFYLSIAVFIALVLFLSLCVAYYVSNQDGLLNKTILRTELDSRNYKAIVLSNSLKVLLVSDPDIEASAVGMNINVGSFNDPNEIPGLAHLLEHMLMKGSHKYTNSKEFQNFLEENRGEKNEITGSEITLFYFTIDNSRLQNALEIFSRYFLEPMFNKDSFIPEIKEIEEEYRQIIAKNEYKSQFLMKIMAAEGHPFSRFNIGNEDSLLTFPTKNGITTYLEMLDFHQSHYSANLMNLVIMSKNSIEVLEEWAKNKFSLIKNNLIERTNWKTFPRPYGVDQLGIIAKIKGKTSENKLFLIFPLPEQLSKFKQKPLDYIEFLLRYTGKDGLLSILKRKNLIFSLKTVIYEEASDFSLYGLEILLTKTGINSIPQIMEFVFSYIRKIESDGINAQIFQDLSKISKIGFRFSEPKPISSEIRELTRNLALYPIHNVISGSSIFLDFDENLIRSTLRGFNAKNCIAVVDSSIFKYKNSSDVAQKEKIQKNTSFAEKKQEDHRKIEKKEEDTVFIELKEDEYSKRTNSERRKIGDQVKYRLIDLKEEAESPKEINKETLQKETTKNDKYKYNTLSGTKKDGEPSNINENTIELTSDNSKHSPMTDISFFMEKDKKDHEDNSGNNNNKERENNKAITGSRKNSTVFAIMKNSKSIFHPRFKEVLLSTRLSTKTHANESYFLSKELSGYSQLYDLVFAFEKMDPGLIYRFSNPKNSGFSLPNKNEYIPENFDLIPQCQVLDLIPTPKYYLSRNTTVDKINTDKNVNNSILVNKSNNDGEKLNLNQDLSSNLPHELSKDFNQNLTNKLTLNLTQSILDLNKDISNQIVLNFEQNLPNNNTPNSNETQTTNETQSNFSDIFACSYGDVSNDLAKDYPEIISSTSSLIIWHKLDRSFRMPKIEVWISWENPYVYLSAKEYLMTCLLIRFYSFILSEQIPEIRMNGEFLELSTTYKGLLMRFSGFSDKKQALLDKVFKVLHNETVAEDIFLNIKEETIRDYQTEIMEIDPFKKSRILLQEILKKRLYTAENMLDLLPEITFQELSSFNEKFASTGRLKSLLMGNILNSTALQIMKSASEIMNLTTSSSQEDVFSEKILNISRKWLVFSQNSSGTENSTLKNKGVLNYYQYGVKDIANLTKLFLIINGLDAYSEPLLKVDSEDSVVVSLFHESGIYGITIFLSRSNKTASEVDQDIEGLLLDYDKVLSKYQQEDFEKLKTLILGVLKETDHSLGEKSERYWNEIFSDFLDFDQKSKMKRLIKDMSLADVLEFYRSFFKQICGKATVIIGGKADAMKEAAYVGLKPELKKIGEEIQGVGRFETQPQNK